MRHGKKFMHLGRKSAHRKSMLANMACSLIEHKRINTTLTKAKALKKFFEPLVTKSKDDSTHNRRIVFRYLRNKIAVSELFREISKKIADRPGGYTRVIRLGNRFGDNAEMAMIELVDYNETYSAEDKSKKKTRRRSKKNKDSALDETPAVEETSAVKETPAVEETSAVEETPAVEETSAVEETPAVEETSAMEETPVVEETSAVEETPDDEIPSKEASAVNNEKKENKESNNKKKNKK